MIELVSRANKFSITLQKFAYNFQFIIRRRVLRRKIGGKSGKNALWTTYFCIVACNFIHSPRTSYSQNDRIEGRRVWGQKYFKKKRTTKNTYLCVENILYICRLFVYRYALLLFMKPSRVRVLVICILFNWRFTMARLKLSINFASLTLHFFFSLSNYRLFSVCLYMPGCVHMFLIILVD